MTPRSVGAYQLQTLLGVGGMGEVYRARDPRLGRDVAIKMLPRDVTADPDRLARFQREARVLASLNHPNIATIHGIEDAEGVRAIVMELVEGETLAERLASVAPGRGSDEKGQPVHGRGLSLDDVPAIARQIAEALDAAPRTGDHPPRFETRQHQDYARRRGKGARLRSGEDRWPARCLLGSKRHDDSGGHARRTGIGHGAVHEPRAGPRPGGRQADRYLGIRLRALRNAHRPDPPGRR
jgi:serine/threonine protein kinase